jgi:hypothetical protein
MKRFRLLLTNEVKLFRTAIPIHVVALLQPTIMYLLMSAILVYPTFDMYVDRPTTVEDHALVAAMREVGSPIGLPYINPIPVDWDGGTVSRQIVTMEDENGTPVVVQRYGLIDSNLVKNFRNRLTAAGLRLWNAELGDRAVTVEEYPWLPRDVPYSVYFGLALLPMTAFLAASMLGAILTAQEFELQTIVEYRLSPASLGLVLGARLTRLILFAAIASAILLLAAGLVNEVWPDSVLSVGLVLLPVAVIGGCLGVTAGLTMQRTIPAFLVALVGSFVGWIMGSAFGLAAGFGDLYQRVSRLTPFTHAVELIFPRYFGTEVGDPLVSALVLVLMSAGMVGLASLAYRWRVMRQE